MQNVRPLSASTVRRKTCVRYEPPVGQGGMPEFAFERNYGAVTRSEYCCTSYYLVATLLLLLKTLWTDGYTVPLLLL